MQFTITLAVFIAAVGTSAAPAAEMTKRLDTIPLSVTPVPAATPASP
jgi:hypothetical protein